MLQTIRWQASTLAWGLCCALSLGAVACGDDDDAPGQEPDASSGDAEMSDGAMADVSNPDGSGADSGSDDDAMTGDTATTDTSADSGSGADSGAADTSPDAEQDADGSGAADALADCADFFSEHADDYTFVPNPDRAIDPLGTEFGGASHEAQLTADGTFTIIGATTTYTFSPDEGVECVTDPEVNVRYFDAVTSVYALLQYDSGSWALELYESEAADTSRASLRVDSGPGDAIYAGLAGTYDVASVSEGTHARMSLTISADGGIDFDTGIAFTGAELSEAYDRVDACGGYWVEFNKGDGSDYPRFKLYVDDEGELEQVWFYPNYPSSNETVVLIQAGAAEPDC